MTQRPETKRMRTWKWIPARNRLAAAPKSPAAPKSQMLEEDDTVEEDR